MAEKKSTSARPASKERGEMALILEGVEYVLRPSHEAIEEVEQLTGKSLLQLAREALQAKLTTSEIAQIATEFIRAFGRATESPAIAASKAPRIRELIGEAEGGFQSGMSAIAAVLSLASTGGYTASGELKAATIPTTEDPHAAA